jgi:hypothetical protein
MKFRPFIITYLQLDGKEKWGWGDWCGEIWSLAADDEFAFPLALFLFRAPNSTKIAVTVPVR